VEAEPIRRVRCPKCDDEGLLRKYHSGTGLLLCVEHVDAGLGGGSIRRRCYLGWAYRLRRDDGAELARASAKWWRAFAGPGPAVVLRARDYELYDELFD